MTEICTECGHRQVFHGDRAVTACDGGYGATDVNAWMKRQNGQPGDRRVCSCSGWRSR